MAEEQQLSEGQKRKIADALENKRVTDRGCPMCGASAWVLADGYVNAPLQPQLGGLVIGGPTIPTAVIICSNCGFLSQHALGALGLLPEKKAAEEAK